MRSADRLSALFFVLLSVCICWLSLRLPRGSFDVPGPMVFPLLLGLCLLILSVVLFIQAGSQRESGSSTLFAGGEGWKVIYLLATFFFCLFIFEPAGFLISIFVLMTLLLKGVGGKGLAKSILYGLVISISMYLLFTRLLNVRLPKGVLNFF